MMTRDHISFALRSRLLLVSVLLFGCLLSGLALREKSVSATSLTATPAASPSASYRTCKARRRRTTSNNTASTHRSAQRWPQRAMPSSQWRTLSEPKQARGFICTIQHSITGAFFSPARVQLEMAEGLLSERRAMGHATERRGLWRAAA